MDGRWVVSASHHSEKPVELKKVGVAVKGAEEVSKYKKLSELFTKICTSEEVLSKKLVKVPFKDVEVTNLGKGKQKFDVQNLSLVKAADRNGFIFKALRPESYQRIEQFNGKLSVGSIVVLKVSLFGEEHISTEFYVAKVRPTVLVENRSLAWNSPRAAAVTRVFQDATTEILAKTT